MSARFGVVGGTRSSAANLSFGFGKSFAIRSLTAVLCRVSAVSDMRFGQKPHFG
jgi:hypothetical protein